MMNKSKHPEKRTSTAPADAAASAAEESHKLASKIAAFSEPQIVPDASEIHLVELDGKIYRLCFNVRALARAEEHFRRQGHTANLLLALPVITFDSVTRVFPCALHHFHPEITWEQAQALIEIKTIFVIAGAIADAIRAALGVDEPEPGAPTGGANDEARASSEVVIR